MPDVHVHPRTLGSGAVRWRLQYRVDGKQGVRTFTTEQAARRWEAVFKAMGTRPGLAMLDAQDDPEENTPAVVTVAAAAGRHLAQLTGVTAATRRDYENIAARDILPVLGEVPMFELDRGKISEWVNGLEAAGAAAKTIANKHGLLSAICTTAVEAGDLPRNPCRGVRLPRGTSREPVFLTTAQLGELVAAVPEYWRPLVVVLAGTGMRWGEVTALRAEEITVSPGQVLVRVHRAWKRSPSGGPLIAGVPKSDLSRRVVPLDRSSPAAEILARRASENSGGRLLFTSPRGAAVRTGYFHDRAWSPALDLLAAERRWTVRPRVHDLRHTAASLMLAAGHEPHAIAAVMGHDILVTLRIYGHHSAGAREAAMGSLGTTLAAALKEGDGQ